MKRFIWVALPFLSFFVMACTTSTPNPTPSPEQNSTTDLEKIENIHWLSSHEESEGDFGAYRKEGYTFPLSRGPRCGFTIHKDGAFIHESIHPADAGCIEQPGTWKVGGNNTIDVSLKETTFEQFEYDARNYTLEYRLEGEVLKAKTTDEPHQTRSETNPDEITVYLAENFRIEKGETAKLDGANVSLKITGFINSPCPEGTQCIWSGLMVQYELSVDGKAYGNANNLSMTDAPYEVSVVDSNYETYAIMQITPQ